MESRHALLRTLIVDDEPIARMILREELESVDQVDIVGEAENGESALSQISVKRPHLVFLDIEMPVMGGFEMLQHLRGGHMPAIVMVTAYDQHAIRAFETGAMDYLLKPVSRERLLQAVERATLLQRSPDQIAEKIAQFQEIAPIPRSEGSPIRKIVGRIGEEYFLLNIEEVLALQVTGDLVWIITGKHRYLATQNLKTMAERLQGSSFRRIHRNALVNIDQIRKMSMLSSQRWLITLNNGQEFTVSKRQAKMVRDILHW